MDLIVATPGLEPPTFWVPVMYLSHKAAGLKKTKPGVKRNKGVVFQAVHLRA